ncbi:MAG TPA: DUF4397 domain-containing protein [Streptosporangiaceae bacterium]|nr:DUF4397 domain-containing protein [Streptosporangiaceae bacterium]
MRLIRPRYAIAKGLIASAAVASLFASAAPVFAAAHARTAPFAHTGYLRLAHLSPNTPPVDVYLYSLRNPRAEVVLHHVSYGTVSKYLPTQAGTYTVAMRAAGAAPTSAPVLSTGVTVKVGRAYTVAGMGPKAGLRLVVMDDQLTAPTGHSMVRVIQASMREHLVTVRTKTHLFGRNLIFASATPFESMPRGSYLVRADGSSEAASDQVALRSGTIHTLVVLDGRGHLKLVDLTDAVGATTLPATAPATGFGGLAASAAGPSLLPWAIVISAGLLLAAVGLASLRRSRRQQA